MTAEEVIKEMIKIIRERLDVLANVFDEENLQFEYGEKTAYVECLEILQEWSEAAANGLNFNIEGKYPL